MEGELNQAPKKNKLGLIIIVIVVVLGLAAGGYYLLSKKSGTEGVLSSVVPKSLNPNCKYNDPDLCKFINGWKDVKYLTMTSSSTVEGKAVTFVYKMSGDDTQMTSTEAGKENFNTISIGNTTYTKDYSDNKWFNYTPTATTTDTYTESEESKIDFDEADDKTTYEKIGTEKCGNLTCFKYKVVDPANTESTEYIYFDNKDYKLRKTRSEMKDGTVSESTLDYAKVTISAPSPTKEGSPYDALNSSTAPTTSVPVTTTPPATTAPSSDTPTSVPEENYDPGTDVITPEESVPIE